MENKFDFIYIDDRNLCIKLSTELKVFDVAFRPLPIDVQCIYKELIKSFINSCICMKEINIIVDINDAKIDYQDNGVIATLSPKIKGLSYKDEIENIDFIMVFEVIDFKIYLISMNLMYTSKYYVYDVEGCCYNDVSTANYSYNCLIL